MGIQAHLGIAAYYAAHHPFEDIETNFTNIGRVLAGLSLLGIEHARDGLGLETDLLLMPDIVNLTLGHLYEIKPYTQPGQALGKAETYAAILWSMGIGRFQGSCRPQSSRRRHARMVWATGRLRGCNTTRWIVLATGIRRAQIARFELVAHDSLSCPRFGHNVREADITRHRAGPWFDMSGIRTNA